MEVTASMRSILHCTGLGLVLPVAQVRSNRRKLLDGKIREPVAAAFGQLRTFVTGAVEASVLQALAVWEVHRELRNDDGSPKLMVGTGACDDGAVTTRMVLRGSA